MSLAQQIEQKSRVRFKAKPATKEAIESLRSLGVPEDALAVYGQFTPARMAEIGKVRLLAASFIPSENNEGIVPGSYANACDYVVFATNVYGDAYCFDKKAKGFPSTAPVMLIAHDLEPENDRMKREDLEKLAKPVATNFEDFLQKFVDEKLDLEPLYPKYDF